MKKLFLFLLLAFAPCFHSIAHPAWGIVVDKHKNIYFADIVHNGRGSVWKLNPDGKLELLLGDFHAHNVSIDKEGNLYTAHGEGNHTMLRLPPNGKIDTLISTTDIKAFFGGNCTYSPNGEILFSIHNRIWAIDKEGNKRQASEHIFKWTQTIYADEEGNIYAPDIKIGKGSLVKIDSNGKSYTIATNLYSKLDRPINPHQDVLLGITKGCDDHIYIAETAGQRIIKILEDGQTETFYKSDGDWFPCGIDFFAGDAYILESRFGKNGLVGPRITLITEQGKKSILFEYGKTQPVSNTETEEQAPESPKEEKGPTLLFVFSLFIAFAISAIVASISQQKWKEKKEQEELEKDRKETAKWFDYD